MVIDFLSENTDSLLVCVCVCFFFFFFFQANMKLNEQQLASMSTPRAVRQFLEAQRENITNIIKQNIAVGDIFKRENLQVSTHFFLNPSIDEYCKSFEKGVISIRQQ